jgi:xylan 1,4-beta-xylosidase
MKRVLMILPLIFCHLVNAQKPAEYVNPVLAGFYPDPSICRVGDDYYMVTSSFAYYPGLPVFHSKDLVNWIQLGHAMDRPEQLDLGGAGVSRGLFAPTIRYYKGLYYIVCTLIDKGGNFVITAKKPGGPWSNPAWLKNVDGIDPSLYFDESTDKAYIIYNSIPPDNKALYDGHRTIRMRNFDYKNLKAGDEEKLIVNGGTDIAKKPVWIEAPHIYRINNWYYLLCAEGGTGYNHSEVVFRSKNAEGPFEPYSDNPVLTQRDLDPNRKDAITTTGHADLVQNTYGQWYAVFLGCRPYEGDFYNTGRETFLAPIRWKDDWPVITERQEKLKYFYPLPYSDNSEVSADPLNGNFTYTTNFPGFGQKLEPRFIFLRTVREKWYQTFGKKLFLRMKLRPETISGTGNPSFIGFRQQHLKCTVSTKIEAEFSAANEKKGLVIFQNEHHFYYLCTSVKDARPVIELYKSTPTEEMELLASDNFPSRAVFANLRIVSEGPTYSFYWCADTDITDSNVAWKPILTGVDGKFLSTKVAGGFVGSVFGMYATSLGKPSSAYATYHLFEYKGNDDIYK